MIRGTRGPEAQLDLTVTRHYLLLRLFVTNFKPMTLETCLFKS